MYAVHRLFSRNQNFGREINTRLLDSHVNALLSYSGGFASRALVAITTILMHAVCGITRSVGFLCYDFGEYFDCLGLEVF